MAIRVEVVDWWAIGESFCHIISRDRFVVRWSMALTVCYALLVLAAGAGAFYSLRGIRMHRHRHPLDDLGCGTLCPDSRVGLLSGDEAESARRVLTLFPGIR